MNQYYATLLQTIPGRDMRPQVKRSLLPHLPIYDRLLSLANERDQARRDGNSWLAAHLKEEAQQIFDGWFDEQDLRLSLEDEEAQQLTAARAYAGAMALDIDTSCGF